MPNRCRAGPNRYRLVNGVGDAVRTCNATTGKYSGAPRQCEVQSDESGSLRFSGSTHEFVTPQPRGTFAHATYTEFSMEIWIRLDEVLSSYNGSIWSSEASSPGRMHFDVHASDQAGASVTITFSIDTNGGTLAVTSSLSCTTWYHILVSYDAAAALSLYKNGKLVQQEDVAAGTTRHGWCCHPHLRRLSSLLSSIYP